MRYDWPGNVRELRAAVDHGVVLATGPKITLRDLPLALRQWSGDPAPTSPGASVSLLARSAAMAVADHLNIHQSEDALIRRALDETDGNITEAARKLGISRRTLHRKLKPAEKAEGRPESVTRRAATTQQAAGDPLAQDA